MEWRKGKEEREESEKLLEILPRVRWGRCMARRYIGAEFLTRGADGMISHRI